MRPVDDDYTPAPPASDKATAKVCDAAAFLLNTMALTLIIIALPLGVWLWKVAL